MSEAATLQAFVREALVDLGAEVSEAESLLWVRAPESVQRELEVGAEFALAFDPAHVGEFGAELVAPGSYFLERLFARATRRGRWDAVRVRVEAVDRSWVAPAIAASGLADVATPEGVELTEDALLVFSFRTTLASDEKREAFHGFAVSTADDSVWAVDGADASAVVPVPLSDLRTKLEPAYRRASEALTNRMRDEVERFRAKSLGLLEEEVRRIFGYFDRTISEIREADPDGSADLVRAVMAERDRRLAEALERFEPRATATLCSIRAVLTPSVRMRVRLDDGDAEVRLDAWSRQARVTRAESVRLPGRPPSDIPRRGTPADAGGERAPRGPKARSRAASAGRRRP